MRNNVMKTNNFKLLLNLVMIAIATVFIAILFTSCSSVDESEAKYEINSLSGLTQKGPFIHGTIVTLLELDSNFIQTGNSYRSVIKSDKGDFNFDGIGLNSNYAYMEVSGYYRNEVTGKITDSELTLLVFADLSTRNSININIATQLESERVMSLLRDSNYTFTNAKNKAESEVFSIFDIENINEDSEDLSIFSNSNGDAALLAISVLLQNDNSVPELTELIIEISESVKKFGKWDNEKSKVEIADWASSVSLDSIRTNIMNWGISDTLPDFEYYIHNYWTKAFNLNSCNASNEGVIELNSNPKSKYFTQEFICKDDSWKLATELEINTYKLIGSLTGELQYGHDSLVKYVYDSNSFREANELEIAIGIGCTSYNEGKVYESSYEGINSYLYGEYKCDEGNLTRHYQLDSISYKGKTYGTTVIGNQTWMTNNLDVDTLVNEGSQCYNWLIKDSESCDSLGRKYSWSTAMKLDTSANSVRWNSIPNHQGLCPDGWHIPSKSEWEILYNYAFDRVGRSTDDEETDIYRSQEFSKALCSTSIQSLLSQDNGTDLFKLNLNPCERYWAASDEVLDQATIVGNFNMHDLGHVLSNEMSFPIRCIKNNN